MDRCTATPWILGCSLALALAGCGDNVAGSASDSNASQVTTAGPSTGETPTSGVEPTGGSGTGTATASGSTGVTTGGSDSETGDSTSTTGSTGPISGTSGTTTGGTTETSDSVGTTDSSGSSSGGMLPDMGGNNCEAKCGEAGWSYVFIANSGENTLSKIDTRDMIEVGRYRTRPDHLGLPSRTSVSIDAKAVVVANRSGGITKIWSRPEYCTDKNNNGQIDTSSGKNNVLPFDQEECVAWHTPFPGATTQRPVAWTSGVYNDQTCEYENQQIWTAASYGVGGTCTGADGIYVYRLNGDTGAIDDTVHLPNVPCGALGAYGAAVDKDNNVWFFVFGGGLIFRVDHETLQHEVVYKGFYGITVDTKSRVWLDDGSRYDPMTKTWANQIGDLPPNGGSGVAVDLKGRVWHATAGGIGWLDQDTMVVGGKVNLGIQGIARGIGVDVDGYIWAVPLSSTIAYRIHPDTFEIATYDGLNQPYTYSDMAGGQINNVICPQ